jgi:AAA family ATP:ADP antiporter
LEILKKVQEINSVIWGLEREDKRNLFLIGATLFFVFFSYPLMRSTTTSLLLTHLGAKSSPYAWIFSVLALSFSVSILNHFQKTVRAQILYVGISIVTLSLFIIFWIGFKFSGELWTYPLYVLKEVYIVLLVHNILAHLNTSIVESVAKIIYGPLGAVGSLGGILGGLLTSSYAKEWGLLALFIMGLLMIGMTIPLFAVTTNRNVHLKDAKEKSPLKSIQGIKTFVFLVAGIVLLSQFVINIGNYQFNIFLSEAFESSIMKTEFLGKIYASINGCSLVIQILLLPLLFRYVPHFFTHLSLPLVYGLSFFGLNLIIGDGLMPMAVTFIIFKGLDYSLFGSAKELLYYALSDIQKYGAKYVADMITYRFAKGLVSLILIKIPTNLINSLLGVCLLAWIICLIPLFRQYKKYHDLMEEINESTTL